MNEKTNTYGLFLDGEWVITDSNIIVRNKYTDDVMGTVSRAKKEHVQKAVDSAERAFKTKQLTPYQRYQVLRNAAEIMLNRKEELAEIIVGEVGKTIKEAISEVERAAFVLNLCGEEAKRITGEMLPLSSIPGSENRLGYTLRQPLGVVCAITPFNFPLNLVVHKVGPAIAAGNTLILKPASTTPISSIYLCEILINAGLPPQHLQLLTGSGEEIGEWLTADTRIKKFSVTGSVDVGKRILEKAGIKRVTLELGNNSPTIVHLDADIEKAADLCVRRGFAVAGQACISVQRVYIHSNIMESFLQKAIEVTNSLVTGNPYSLETDVGPMISAQETIRIEEWIKEAVEDGAVIKTGGKRKDNFFEPTILTNVKPEMKVVCEEIFGPVITVISYDDIEEAINWANESQFGLQAGIFTSDISLAMKVATQLEYGGVMVNDTSYYRGDSMPYGGIKNSGIGREGPKYAIEEMMETKSIVLNLA